MIIFIIGQNNNKEDSDIDEDNICNPSCKNKDLCILIEDKCLFRNYSFIAIYNSNESLYINSSYLDSINFTEDKNKSNKNKAIIYFYMIKTLNSLEYMFKDIYNMTLIYFTNFDSSNISNMESMFYGCSSLTSIYISNFNTSNVKQTNE